MNDLIDRSRGNLSTVSLRREVAVRGALRDFVPAFVMIVFFVIACAL